MNVAPARIAVIFDLDGTLIDSVPDIHAAVNRVLEDEGHAALDMPSVLSFVGNGLPRLVDRVMAARGIDPAQHARLTQATLNQYNAASSQLTRIYPGVETALRDLLAAGQILGICTNKPEAPARAILSRLGLLPLFASVVGGDRLPVLKPDPAPLALCLAELGGGPMVFVGDSEVDADTAIAAGCDFLLFSEGYRKSPVAVLRHRAAFANFAQLPGLVAGLRS